MHDDDVLRDDDDGAQLYEHFRFTANREQSPLRIDKYLTDRLSNISRSRISLAAEAGCIFVNDTPVKSNYKVKPDDVISVMMTRPRNELEIVAENIPLDIVYEDDVLMVINKPAGMVVHPGHGNWQGTLLNALAYYLRDVPGFDASDPNLGLVHRIDKDTSGLLVIAKHTDAKAHLSRQFFNKTTKRLYKAIVWGIPRDNEGRIEGNIGRDPHDRQRMTVFPDGEQGKNAVTHWRISEKLGYVALMEFRLETGRTHQIRVHTAYIGHPVFNDAKYGGDQILKGLPTATYRQFVHNCFEICPRQALHAATLGFVHPCTGEEMFFEAEIPEDMLNLIYKWRTYISFGDGK
jgi:23S rRNA pseudouridine1911/1915/1917 synthase